MKTSITFFVLFVLLMSSCQDNKKEIDSHISEAEVIDKGMMIAAKTQSTLAMNLKEQMQAAGVIGALDFCKIQALPLTDSLAKINSVIIKRVSDRARNPLNKANEEELGHIQSFKDQTKAGGGYTPIVTTVGDRSSFYYPIITSSLCLKCHGSPEKELEMPTFNRIRELYPEDQAIGYSENEVRGIWHIQFSHGL